MPESIVQNKKMIILMILFFFLLSAVIFLVYKIKNNNLVDKNITVKTAINSNNTRLTSIETPGIKTVTKNDCEKMIDSTKRKDCLDYLSIKSMIQNNEIGKAELVCKKIGPEWQDSCNFTVAVSSGKNWNLCSTIKDKTISDLCWRQKAISDNNLDVCGNLKWQAYNDCRDSVIANNYYEIDKCKEIKNPKYFETCILLKKDDCRNFSDKALAGKCQAIRTFNQTITTKKKEDCLKITLEQYRKVCEEYFKAGRFGDSDQDGASDREELIIGTNPFVKEADVLGKVMVIREQPKFTNNIYNIIDNK
jgi:hypothetical protein